MAETKVSPLAPAAFPAMPAVAGLRLATAAAGIRYQGRDDVMLAEMPPGTTVAGTFTRSLCTAAPVDWCKDALAASAGHGRAIIVNSGNANAFTGAAGYAAAEHTAESVAGVLGAVALPGRQQVLAGEVEKIIDVAHNHDSVRALRSALRVRNAQGNTLCVFSMLKDKDIEGSTACLRDVVDDWFVSGLPGPRGLDADRLVGRMAPGLGPSVHHDIAAAYRAACRSARPGDRVVVWGSFQAARAALEIESGGSSG